MAAVKLSYWDRRKDDVYYTMFARYMQIIGFDAVSMLDVGGGPIPVLTWFDWIPDRATLDLSPPPDLPGVRSMTADFLTWEPDKHYDVVTCLQVLEHIEDPAPFAAKLVEVGRRVLVSVPYKWMGGTPGHVQDPVDEAKLRSWFPIPPNYIQYVYEPFGPPRMFAYFDVERGPAFRYDLEFGIAARRTRRLNW